jgi:Cu2+-exporting ATPase
MATPVHHEQHTHSGHGSDGTARVAEVDIRNAYNGTEYSDLEAYFGGLPGVTSVHLDRTRGVAHVAYDPAVTSAEQLEEALARCGYRCDCTTREGSRSQVGHPALHGEHGPGATDHAAMGHEGAGTRRMSAGGEHAGAPPRSGGPGHDEHAGHGAAMVNDLLRRFVVSLTLTLPIIAFSPMSAMAGLPAMPPVGLSMARFGFLLTTPVVWWGGWPFISASPDTGWRCEAAWRPERRWRHS